MVRGIALLLISLASITGCLSGPSASSLTDVFKKDLKFTINGTQYEGLATVPQASTYSISLTPDKPFDLFVASTCHREIDADQVSIAQRKRLFGPSSKTSIRFSYTPRALIETNTYCGLELGIYDRDNGQEYWGFVDFVDLNPKALSATIFCNGDRIDTQGGGVCQSRSGLVQRIEFDEPVTVVSDCLQFQEIDKATYSFVAPIETCLALFYAGEREYRLTSFGYNKIKIKAYGG